MASADQSQKISPGLVVLGLLALFLCYLAALSIYRLYFSPLAKFPGPRLAALTKWYEFYYEVVLNGKFTFEIRRMHEIYGPIVRITPHELHIDDFGFWDTLYAKYPKSEKYSWMNGRFGNETSIFTTCDPVHHRQRRAPLGPMFSRRAIVQQEPLVHELLNNLIIKLKEYYENDKVVSVQKMWSAFGCDVITEYAFGLSYNQIDSPDFSDSLHDAYIAASEFGHVSLQFPWLAKILNCLPDTWVESMNPSLEKLLRLKRDLTSIVSRIGLEHARQEAPSKRTIFHEIMQSSLAAPEKETGRLADEAQTIVGGGLTTTSWALTIAMYYLQQNPGTLEKLRTELFEAVPNPSDPDAFAFSKLEPLPYLRACVREGIRLSYVVSARMPRIISTPVVFQEWVIPAGTPISMTMLDVHFNEQLYPKANEFVPERWLGNPKAPDGESLEKYWVAFGKGPRNCLGINFAYMEMTIALATFYRQLQWKLYETDFSDIELQHDFFLPSPRRDSPGVRMKIVAFDA